jgi:hypothetical protein
MTADHDEAELWLSSHYEEIINFMKPIIDNKYSSVKNKKITRTKLLLERTFSGKIIDALILIEIESDKPTSTFRSDLTIILDIKSKIERVSEIQGQVNRYSDIIAAVYRRPIKVILTLHNLDKYDKMMYNQDIYVIYVPHNVIYENLQLPKTSFKRRDKYMT